MSHRTSPKRPAFLLIAFLVIAAAAVAAASAATSNNSRTASTSGVLNWGAGILPSSWDPFLSNNGNDAISLNLVYAGLTRLDPKGNPQPALATSWKFVNKGLGLQFTLRRGIKFTDGTPFDAGAVKANILRDKQPAGLNSPQLSTIDSASVINRYTVRLNLNALDYGLPLRLAGIAGLLVSPKAFTSNASSLPTNPVGAGPFKLSKFVAGSSASLVANPGYWDAKNIHLKGVNISQIIDQQTLLAALQSGQIDVATISGTIANAARNAGLHVQVVPSLMTGNIEVNAAMDPFTDHRVVQAINYALNRKALLQTYNGGIGAVDQQPFPPGNVGYSKQDAVRYTYNPAKAKQILAQIGKPVSFPITYIDVAPSNTVAEQIQGELSAVGINATLKSIPSLQWTRDVYANHSVAFTQGYNAGRESPLQTLSVQFSAQGLLNPCRCASAALTKAFAKANAVPIDSPDYPAAVQNVTHIALNESANMFLFSVPRIYAYNKNVKHWPNYIVLPRLEGVTVN